MDQRVWVPAVAALVAATIGAAAAIASAVISKGDEGQHCEQSGQNNTQICDIRPPQVDPSADSRAAAKAIFRDLAPIGPGPWPFVVLNDDIDGVNVGQYVLSAPTRSGHHIGLALHASTLWVECQLISDFDPDPNSGNGARWLRIRWSHDPKISTDVPGSSSPSDPFDGFVYAAYPAPDGNNGSVPACSR